MLCLWEIVGASRGASDTQDGLSSLLDLDPHALLLAESGGAVIGTLIAAWDGWRASFYRLAVHPGWRRLGIAIALLRHGERHLTERGAVRLAAIVADDDPVATDFWRAAGYQQQSNRARFVRLPAGEIAPSPAGS